MSDFSFSKRTDWSFQNNPLSLKLEELKQQKIEIIDLTQSNPTECGFTYASEILSAFKDQKNLTYAPVSKGHLSARQSIVQYYLEKNLTVDPEHLVLTSSTSEGYSFLLKLLTNPGDHVLIPQPSYPLFQFLLELHDVSFDYYPLVYKEGWAIDKQMFQKMITPKTKAVILVNPNNPTGSFISQDEKEFLNQVCLKHHLSIISDEVFLDYPLSLGIKPHSFVNNTPVPSFVLSGISKILALPQMKLSWIAVNGPHTFVQQALERLDIIADTYLSVNTPVQHAVNVWLPQRHKIQTQILERVKANWKILKEHNFKLLSAAGGWYAIIHGPRIESEEEFILTLLEKDHVLVHPGFFFDFEQEGYLILSLLPQSDQFLQGVKKIAQRIDLL